MHWLRPISPNFDQISPFSSPVGNLAPIPPSAVRNNNIFFSFIWTSLPPTLFDILLKKVDGTLLWMVLGWCFSRFLEENITGFLFIRSRKMLFRTAPSFKFKKLNSLSFLLHLEISSSERKISSKKTYQSPKNWCWWTNHLLKEGQCKWRLSHIFPRNYFPMIV